MSYVWGGKYDDDAPTIDPATEINKGNKPPPFDTKIRSLQMVQYSDQGYHCSISEI